MNLGEARTWGKGELEGGANLGRGRSWEECELGRDANLGEEGENGGAKEI